MSESKITPGPWSWEFSRVSEKRIALSNHSGQDVMTATSDLDDNLFIDIGEENARLIAAAPDLLALLEKAIENCPREACCIDWHARARAVVAKAKGETQ